MKGLPLAAVVLGLLAGLAAPSLAQNPRPSPSPSPKKETPTYTGDDLDRLAGRTPGEAPKNAAPAPPPDVPRVIESEAASAGKFEIKVERTREGHEGEAPDPTQGSWGERAKALRDQAAQAEEHVKALDSQAQTLLWQYLQSTDTNEILQLKAEQQEILDQIPEAKKAAEEATKAVADFEREATQAGVPPSEIREKKNP